MSCRRARRIRFERHRKTRRDSWDRKYSRSSIRGALAWRAAWAVSAERRQWKQKGERRRSLSVAWRVSVQSAALMSTTIEITHQFDAARAARRVPFKVRDLGL